MNTTHETPIFAIQPSARDFVVIDTLAPIVYPRRLCAVGAARCRNEFVLVPLVELTEPRGTLPRCPQLWIPPWPGILRFTAAPCKRLDGGELAERLFGYLRMVGAQPAYLHVDLRGAPDTGHEATASRDIRTGRPLFVALDRPYLGPIDKAGMELLILNATNFSFEAQVVDPGEVLVAPPLMATHVRALTAAIVAISQATTENSRPAAKFETMGIAP